MPPLQSRKRRPVCYMSPSYLCLVLTICISQPPDEDSDDQDTSPPQRRKLTHKAQTQVQRRGGESSTQGARRNQRSASLDEDEEDTGSGDGGDEDSSKIPPSHHLGGYYNGNLWACVGDANKDRLVKKFIRLALASEYTRQPLKRVDITSKGLSVLRLCWDLPWRDLLIWLVLGSQGRMFKEVFEQSQKELRHIFGMELVELPTREKTKLSQRRGI